MTPLQTAEHSPSSDEESPPADSSGSESSNDDTKRFAVKTAIWILVVIGGLVVFRWMFPDVDQQQLKELGVRLPHAIFLPAYAVLPMLGFPITPFLVASGLKYGFWWSIPIAAVCMAFHTFAAWHLAHGFLRRRLKGLLARTSQNAPSIPKKHQTWFAIVYITVPGLPYSLKLYSLALTNIPFVRFMLIAWLGHLVNSIPFIGLGTAAAGFDFRLLAVFSVFAVLMTGMGYWLKRRSQKT